MKTNKFGSAAIVAAVSVGLYFILGLLLGSLMYYPLPQFLVIFGANNSAWLILAKCVKKAEIKPFVLFALVVSFLTMFILNFVDAFMYRTAYSISMTLSGSLLMYKIIYLILRFVGILICSLLAMGKFNKILDSTDGKSLFENLTVDQIHDFGMLQQSMEEALAKKYTDASNATVCTDKMVITKSDDMYQLSGFWTNGQTGQKKFTAFAIFAGGQWVVSVR